MTPFQPGEVVALAGRRGTYRVVRQDGDVLHVYGGDRDPRGRRMHRAVSVSLARQPREQAIPCRECGAPCWSIEGLCVRHDGHGAA